MAIDFGTTIAAISTPFGSNGIGIVRISGNNAHSILLKLLKKKSLVQDRKLCLGHIFASDHIVDEVLYVFMKSPRTYTCENMAEVHTHGNYFSLKAVLDLFLNNGCVLAEPGEFTQRAFLNGRIDLTAADAVQTVINAKSEIMHQIAVSALTGKTAKVMADLRENLLELKAQLEYIIDVDDSDHILYEQKKLEEKLTVLINQIHSMVISSEKMLHLSNGLTLGIFGRPNVGKSSLFNYLLEKERAIVSSTPGTTRDYLEDSINHHGLPITLIDTAGYRKAVNDIEREGIRRTKRVIQKSDKILLVLDYEDSIEDIEAMCQICDFKNAIFLVNKIDVKINMTLVQYIKTKTDQKVYLVSVVNAQGIDQILDDLYQEYIGGELKKSDICLTNMVQLRELKNATGFLSEAHLLVKKNDYLDLVAEKVDLAADALRRITGEIKSEDVIQKIFSTFCVGK